MKNDRLYEALLAIVVVWTSLLIVALVVTLREAIR